MARFGNRVTVGLAFADYQADHGIVYSTLPEAEQTELRQAGKDVLAGVTEDPATRDAAIASIPAFFNVSAASGCPVFPANNIWNVRVDALPVHVRSDAWIDSIGCDTGLHLDFGSGTWDGDPIGIPYNRVSESGD